MLWIYQHTNQPWLQQHCHNYSLTRHSKANLQAVIQGASKSLQSCVIPAPAVASVAYFWQKDMQHLVSVWAKVLFDSLKQTQ